ncbi:MAG: glycosyltransferase family 4 protein [Longimicrobiales bacterium]
MSEQRTQSYPAAPIRLHTIRTHFPHWGEHSGLHQFLKHLDAAEFTVCEHVAHDSDDDFPFANPILRAVLRRAVQRRGMDWYKLSDATAEWRVLRESRNGSIDLVHYLDGEHSARYLPWLRSFRARPRLIATYHQPGSALAGLVRRSDVARLDAITVVSPVQREFFEQFTPAVRVHTILHGVDATFFHPAAGGAGNGHDAFGGVDHVEGVAHGPAAAPARDETFACITVGHYLRDFETLRRVAERLADHPEICFDVVTNRETGLERLRNVRIHRTISDGALRDLYQQADVLLLPLTDCTANNALLEGMACGLPVVTSDLPSVRIYAPDHEAIRVAGPDADAFAHAILELRSSAGRRERMARAARARARTLAWPRIAPAYAALYRDLA